MPFIHQKQILNDPRLKLSGISKVVEEKISNKFKDARKRSASTLKKFQNWRCHVVNVEWTNPIKCHMSHLYFL